jgi:licheninase
VLTKPLRLTAFGIVRCGITLIVVLTVIAALGAAKTAPPNLNGHCPTTAADLLGWGAPNRSEDFNDPSALSRWKLYNGAGHAGNGQRTPSAASVADGMLTITGDAEGNSEGMAWNPGQMYGRWEACVQSTPASPNYHSVLLLWPDSENWPSDGEIDFMEILDPDRQKVTASVLAIRPDDQQQSLMDHIDHAEIVIDATKWHSWAVEWTPDRVAGYVDGTQWFEITKRIPRSAMHLCIQLDNFGGDISKGGREIVDWVRQYPVPSLKP